MNIDRIANIFGTIVIVAGVAVVVSSPRTANIIRAMGDSFSGALNAATRPAR